MDKGKGCPKCGGDCFFSHFKGRQYYKSDGTPDGYHFDDVETKTVYCLKCGYRTTLERLRERSKKE